MHLGIIYAILFLIQTTLLYFTPYGDSQTSGYFEGMRKTQWFWYFAQASFHVLLTQLLRVRALRKSLTYRIIMSSLFVLTFERLVIFITSLHRDYLPSSRDFGISGWGIIGGLLLKALILAVITLVYFYGKLGLQKQ